jgi:DNA modification methylase
VELYRPLDAAKGPTMETLDAKTLKDVPQEYRTVWVFPDTNQLPIRYLGRCIPEIPRNCLKRFSKPNDLVLDPFMGSGTAVGECIDLGRRVIGLDATDSAIKATEKRLHLYYPRASMESFLDGERNRRVIKPILLKGDARKLPLKDDQIDFVFAHPPYWSVITYSTPEEKNQFDLSRKWKLRLFHEELLKSFREMYRVLKWNKFCAVLIGDVRQGGRKLPLGYTYLTLLLEAGFQFYDLVIKVSENAISMRRPVVVKKALEEDRSVTTHEYVLVVKKSKTKYNDIGLDFLKEKKG